MNNRVFGTEPKKILRREAPGKRRFPPCDANGEFTGDLCFETLIERAETPSVGPYWASVAQDLGFSSGGQDQLPYGKAYRQGRLYVTTFHGGVWTLSEFFELCRDGWEARQFLFRVNNAATQLGRQVSAQPEDVLTLLVLSHSRACFSDRDLVQLGFSDELTESLNLAMQEDWMVRPPHRGPERESRDGEP